MTKNTHSLLSFSAGCTVGGLLTGLCEGLYRGASPLYAALLYGALWTLCGFGGAFAFGILRRRPSFPLAAGVSLSASLSAVVLIRFIVLRDVLAEAPNAGLNATLTSAVAALSIGLLTFFLVRFISLQVPGSPRFAGIIPTMTLCLFISWAFSNPTPNSTPLPEPGPRGSGAKGVILVVADTLRADALGSYGGVHPDGRPPSPHLDQFAEQGLRFKDMSAQASWTKPAMASILTSLHPGSHRTMSKQAVLPDDVDTLAEVLAGQGVATSAVVTNYNLEESYGFKQGFGGYTYLPPDRYLGAPPRANRLAAYNVYRLLREKFTPTRREARHFYQSGDTVNERGFAFLDSLDSTRPFFLWLHYMEAHDPYFSTSGQSYARVARPNPAPSMARTMRHAYQDDVRRLDTQVGELLAGLKARGLDATTTVLFTSDHGEEFAEHGGFYHGVTLYEEQLHLPLLIRGPGLAPVVSPHLARQVDIAPTIAALLDAEAPPPWEGRDLLGDTKVPQITFAEEDHQGNQLLSARRPTGTESKLILANEDNPRGLHPVEVYLLATDPREQKPSTTPPADLRTAINNYQTQSKTQGVAGVSKELGSDAEAELRSLGYIQ